jgi:hypothetical protein
MSTRPRKKITTTTSYKRKKKTDLAIPFFRVGNFWNKKVKKKRGRLVNANFERSLVWFLFGCRRRRVHQPIHYYKAIRAAAALDSPFSVFSFERWMLARHTLLLLLLLLCEDLMYSNERAAASARLFSGVPIILG